MPRCYPELNTSDRLRLRRLPVNHLPACPELYPAHTDRRMGSDAMAETARGAVSGKGPEANPESIPRTT